MDTAIHMHTDHHAAAGTGEKVKVDIRDLCFFYGATKSLKKHHPALDGAQSDRLYRAVGLRQVHLAARHQPHLRALSQPAG